MKNEMFKLLNIFYPLVDSSHIQSKLSQCPSFQKIKALKNQEVFPAGCTPASFREFHDLSVGMC